MATVPVVSRGIGRKPPSEIRLDGDVATVALTRGFECSIDAADIPLIAGYRWVALVNSQTGHAYAVRFVRGKCFLMHRELLQAPPELSVDHVDGDGLNNRRANIRLATGTQNNANQAVTRRNKLGVKGVAVSRSGLRFRAFITPKDGRSVFLGSYATKEEAAAAYKGAAKLAFGEYAYDK